MSRNLFKKLSAATAVAVVGIGSFSHAAATYQTGFETSDGFTAGNLVPQNGYQILTNAPAQNTAAVTTGSGVGGGQGVLVTTSANATSGANGADFYTAASAITTPASGIEYISFSVDRITPGAGQTTTPPNFANPQPAGGSRTSFGIDVLTPGGGLLASLYVRNTGVTSTEASQAALFTTNGSADPSTEIFNTAGVAAADGSFGTYALELNFNTKMFTVINGVTGAQSGPYTFVDTSATGIGGVALADLGEGTNTAVFDNLSVVPEPASIAMVGGGALMLIARRRRQTA